MENSCVCCGAILPCEGRQICWDCEHKSLKLDMILQSQNATEEVKSGYEFLYRKDDVNDNAGNYR